MFVTNITFVLHLIILNIVKLLNVDTFSRYFPPVSVVCFIAYVFLLLIDCVSMDSRKVAQWNSSIILMLSDLHAIVHPCGTR